MLTTQPSTNTGLIAFFDVLGYRSLLLNNDVRYCASIIQNVLLRMPEQVRKAMEARAREFDPQWYEQIEKCLARPVVFLDSIVWAYTFNPQLKGGIEIQWLYFILLCCLFQRRMFDEGMPIRGAISFGEYFIAENCFAGTPIVEAHDLSEQLQLVGGAITLKAEQVRPKGPVGGIDAFSGVLVKYPTPLKSAEKLQTHALLNWAFPGGRFLNPFGDRIRFRVIEAFTKHQKPIPSSAQAKVTNTEAFLHYCKNACDRWNRENPGTV
jgi:hypothetical protein